MIYSLAEVQLSIYSVKPAIFDLVLGVAIGAYLAIIYYAVLVRRHSLPARRLLTFCC